MQEEDIENEPKFMCQSNIYKRNLNNVLSSWKNIADINGGHIHYLPNIKKIVNRMITEKCDELIELYDCISYVHDIVNSVEGCGSYCDCSICNRRILFLASLTNYLLKLEKYIEL